MFNLPEKLKCHKPLNKDAFIKRIEGDDRKRYYEAVKSITLEAQISGEGIPSLINDKYNAQVIQFVKIRLNKIKDAALVAKAVQYEMKTPTVIILEDDEENSRLSFAMKRLSEVDKSQIVITGDVLTAEYNQRFGDAFSDSAVQYIAYDKILNKSNKMTYYQEMAAKAYILSNMQLFSGTQALLDSKVWYDAEKVAVLFDKLKHIEQLKKEVRQSVETAEQARLNGEIKRLIGEILNGK